MDGGDAQLLGDGVHVLHDGVLGLADIDNHLGIGGGQGLQVQLTGDGAVELAQGGQVVILGVDKLLSARVPLAGQSHELVGAQGEEHDLGHGAGGGDAVDLGGELHRAAAGVGEHDGVGGVLLRGLGAGGLETEGSGEPEADGLEAGVLWVQAARETTMAQSQQQRQGFLFHKILLTVLKRLYVPPARRGKTWEIPGDAHPHPSVPQGHHLGVDAVEGPDQVLVHHLVGVPWERTWPSFMARIWWEKR